MPPLVFLPGAGGRSSFWRPVADRLADLGPTAVFGWPGFGDLPEDPAVDSLAALQRWLLARLPKEPSHLAGGTHGFAHERPEEVAAAIREHLESAWPR